MRKFIILTVLLVCLNMSGAFAPALAANSPNLQPVRALHIVLRNLTVADAKRLIEMATVARFNTLIFDLREQIEFNNFPNRAMKHAWSREELLEVVSLARQKGLAVIPEVKLLTHQEQLFNEDHPDLMFNRVTYNPGKTQTYDLVFPYLDEIIKLLHPQAIHIGHDEVVGWNKKHLEKVLRPDERALPAEQFLQDVLKIHAYLKQKNVETWMWGDMLISPDEFPSMNPKNLHGSIPGYGRELRGKLPKDIVICDWHYFDDQPDFSSLAAFKAEGFRVLGASWRTPVTIRNFSHYAAAHGAIGMIATTWFVPTSKLDKVINSWDEVNRVIRESGEAFRKDFPDAR